PEHLRRMQAAAQPATGPVFLFRQLAAQFEASPAPLRLLLLPRPDQRLSVQILKRRGPVMADPILIDLPQPVSAIRLRASPRPAPCRLLLLARPAQRLSAQILRRRGPVMADPLLIDLPQPVSAIRLRASPPAATSAPGPMRTIHARHDESRAGTLN